MMIYMRVFISRSFQSYIVPLESFSVPT